MPTSTSLPDIPGKPVTIPMLEIGPVPVATAIVMYLHQKRYN